jgi:hypothetical protein
MPSREITVHLTYNPTNGTVTTNPPSPVRFKIGDRVKFVSDSGKVYVKLNDHAYQPPVFEPGSKPVKVIAEPAGETSSAECGFVKKVNGENVIYGWAPPGVPGRRITPPPTARLSPRTGFETEP